MKFQLLHAVTTKTAHTMTNTFGMMKFATSGKEKMVTNKEAIEALKRIRDEAMNEFVGDWADYEAFNVAIEALKGADDE